MNRENPVFSAKNICVDFKVGGKGLLTRKSTLRALNGVTFDLYAGETLAIVGESGCGKSTICRVAMRFYTPTHGEMIFDDKNIHTLKNAQLAQYRKKVQMIFQDPFSSLNPLHTIYYHLERPLKLHHSYDSQRRLAKMDEYLKMVGLVPPKEHGERYPHELSGGQRQRAYLARILAVGADIVFADEPTSMLDVSIRLGILNLMNDLKKDMGKSFIYITHDIATARYVADRIIVLYAGHMVEWGEVDKVILNPQHPYTKLLIAAAPDPEREGEVELPVIKDKESEITIWTPESSGCPFKSRCPLAKKECAEFFAQAKEVSEGQFVRCIYA